MRSTSDVVIPIPRPRNTHCKVEIAGEDLTNRVIESEWVLPTSNGVGTFKAKLSNAFGQLTGVYSEGDSVKFYADNSDNTTLQFWGELEYPEGDISEQGQFLEIQGRHRSWPLNETFVCYSATGTERSEILKAIIDNHVSDYGFTYANVNTTSDTMDVEWNYKPFWECIAELCNYGTVYDCYVDDNLDFHFFEKNSIMNSDEAIIEGDTHIKSRGWNSNAYYEKTRVIAVGQNEDGLPLVYTAISASEGAVRKEVFIKDTSANTTEKVQAIAEAKLAEVESKPPQAVALSYGLETIKPGDNITAVVPRHQVYGVYRIAQIKHLFGAKHGGWRTECTIEEEEQDISNTIQKVSQKSDRAVQADNPNKLNFSWDFSFNSDSGTHSNTEITEGVLKTDGGASGTWISGVNSLSSNATECEIRVKGETIPGTLFYISPDNGVTWQTLTQNNLKTLAPPGSNLKIKVEFASASTQIYSLVLLYS